MTVNSPLETRDSKPAIRWGILSTARIARTAFLPALRAAEAEAAVVGGRDLERTRAFASESGIRRAVVGYDAVVEDPDVDAVYIPLPNSLHGEWAVRALEAGKAVLCEKPLCGDVTQAVQVLSTARMTRHPLWEAFVFPFHRQQNRLLELVQAEAIGHVREIHSEFHFQLTSSTNIRLAPELGGGGLNDVGCYPIRFAQLIFGRAPVRGTAVATYSDSGVDVDLQGVVEYDGGQRLVLSCGMTRNSGTYSRIVGDEGEIRVTNPFHARDFDTLEIRRGEEVSVEHLGSADPSFTPALQHIAMVVAGEEAPRHTALDDSLGTEVTIDLLRRSTTSGRVEPAAMPSQ